MKAFQIKDDEKRIYFRNMERRPAEEELDEAMDILRKEGCKVGKKQMYGLDDLYKCSIGNEAFNLIYTGEEAFLFSENKETIRKLLMMFEK